MPTPTSKPSGETSAAFVATDEPNRRSDTIINANTLLFSFPYSFLWIITNVSFKSFPSFLHVCLIRIYNILTVYMSIRILNIIKIVMYIELYINEIFNYEAIQIH